MLKLTLPYPPSCNAMYKRAKGGGIMLTEKVGTFRHQVLSLTYGHQDSFLGDVEMQILLYPPDRIRRDIDNPIKQLLDSLQRAKVFKDDYQVRKLTIERMGAEKPGRCEVTIIPL